MHIQIWKTVKQFNNFRTTGKQTLQLTAPDTVTSWVATAFSTNEKSAFGLTDKQEKVHWSV